jgi:hypothetical protein
VWIAAAAGRSNDDLLPNPSGPAIGATWPLNDRLATRVGLSHFADRQTRVGSTCVGLVLDPAECVEERIDSRSALTGVTLEFLATVARRGRLSLSLVPALSAVTVRADSRGAQSGRRLNASSGMIGVSGGAELSVVPSVRWPVALRLGAHAAALQGPEGSIVDGYSAFNDGISLTRFEIGLSVWKPPAATAGARKTR